MTPRVLAVIPARYASTRFPGKPLADIGGKPMIRHVWERVSGLSRIERVIVATDDERIRAAAEAFGAEVRMTDPNHPSGTDRMWEVAAPLAEYDWILNVQGDEPFLDPQDLLAALDGIERFPEADIITLDTPFATLEDWRNPNMVKAVVAESGRALYFSRSPVPCDRDRPDVLPERARRHIGLYLYKRNALERFTQLPPSPLETQEKLEQLRALENGMAIYNVTVEKAALGVDTPEDLNRILQNLSS